MQSKCNKPPVPPTKQENGGSHRAAFSRSLRWPSACQLQWRNSTPVGNKMCVNEQRTRHSAVRSLKRNGLSGVSGIALGPEHPHGGARSSFRGEWAGPMGARFRLSDSQFSRTRYSLPVAFMHVEISRFRQSRGSCRIDHSGGAYSLRKRRR